MNIPPPLPAALPPLKWVGGKRQLFGRLREELPVEIRYRTYHEPMLGGGAFFFGLEPQLYDQARLSDTIPELIRFYRGLSEDPDGVRETYYSLWSDHEPELAYHHVRRTINTDRETRELDDVSYAAHFLFVNKVGFNGLWRVNRRGDCNVPFGKKTALPDLPEPEETYRAVRRLAQAELAVEDVFAALDRVQTGDLVYLDPPYIGRSKTSDFTAYSSEGFKELHEKLVIKTIERFAQTGAHFLLSQSDTPESRTLWDRFDIPYRSVERRQLLSARAASRQPVRELIGRLFP